MELETPTKSTDTTSNSEYLDAEGETEHSDYFHDAQPHEVEKEEQSKSVICEIREELAATTLNVTTATNGDGAPSIPASDALSSSKSKELSASAESLPVSTTTTSSSTTTIATAASNKEIEEEQDLTQTSEWRNMRKHIFILSTAGKPIYALHGNENKLATIFGIIQALVSFVQLGQDALTSIHTQDIKFVFLLRNNLILVAASRTNMSVPQLQMQLSDVYNQILTTLTYSHMTTIFEKRKNFDLRRMLQGSERFINHLLANDSDKKQITNNIFTFMTNSIRVMPLPAAVRSNIVSAIQSNCSKIKNLVFAVLLANNQLITLVRMKKYSIHPADLRLLFNFVECSESFKRNENWTPICLPKFDMNGFLHAHVSYLSEDCQACLLMLSVDRDVFYTLSDAKQRITEKLRRTHCLEAISEEINKRINTKLNLNVIGIPELRHFLYKPRNTAQLLCADIRPPYTTLQEFERLESIYCDLLHRIYNAARPLKLIYKVNEREVVLAWITAEYELYAIFEPMVDKGLVIKYVDKLIKWIDKESDVYFIRQHPTF